VRDFSLQQIFLGRTDFAIGLDLEGLKKLIDYLSIQNENCEKISINKGSSTIGTFKSAKELGGNLERILKLQSFI
jgi:hypothetical protein